MEIYFYPYFTIERIIAFFVCNQTIPAVCIEKKMYKKLKNYSFLLVLLLPLGMLILFHAVGLHALVQETCKYILPLQVS